MLSKLTFSSGCWQSCPSWSRASGWNPRAPLWCGAPSRQLEITALSTRKHNCPTVTQALPSETALGAVPPGLEPWQLLGRVAAAVSHYTAGALHLSRWRAAPPLQPAWPRAEYFHHRHVLTLKINTTVSTCNGDLSHHGKCTVPVRTVPSRRALGDPLASCKDPSTVQYSGCSNF